MPDVRQIPTVVRASCRRFGDLRRGVCPAEVPKRLGIPRGVASGEAPWQIPSGSGCVSGRLFRKGTAEELELLGGMGCTSCTADRTMAAAVRSAPSISLRWAS